ncbi:hypothetical protein OG874_30210 [Nocardia sp. NBC_00565]|uniref:hypothetical protein n=1 Tax=Nocardia sp. NBC_00565 TaxID=2975993 RepID=UPI002E80B297|nr:hypothetical protein [Nocardia sp. NBC_00565]WUC01075.1 hypothetical protein OG874_30210 [Nocardia sp. NBC_00565]
MTELERPQRKEIAPSVRRLLADFHSDTLQKIELAPTDSKPIYQSSDGFLMPVDEDGWVSDSDADLDKADAIPVVPTAVHDVEES